MKRFCSQFAFCSEDNILRRAVVEQSGEGIITRLFSLDSCHSEPPRTVFIDGIISPGIISLKQNASPEELVSAQDNNQYVDLSAGLASNVVRSSRRLIFDFGTDSPFAAGRLLLSSLPYLSSLSVFEIIAASVYYPAAAAGKEGALAPGLKTNLIVWCGIDLVNKKITDRTKIMQL